MGTDYNSVEEEEYGFLGLLEKAATHGSPNQRTARMYTIFSLDFLSKKK